MRKKVFIFIELFIWFLVILVLFNLCSKKILSRHQAFAKLNVSFEDIDGLIVGSPVKYMGVYIGHVVQLDIKDDNTVLITFVITRQGITIPTSSVFSVEFSGLAASKSLEINPNVAISSSKSNFLIEEPFRVKHFFDNQKNIALGIIEMYKNIDTTLSDKNMQKIKVMLKNQNVYTKTNAILDSIISSENEYLEKMEKKE